MSSESNTQLNQEQIHALLNKLSSDEQKELTDAMRNCTSEVTMTRGLPITAAILGSLYISRQRLPSQYHFGPKGWPFYAIMGIASLTATNLMFMGTCRDRIQPRVMELWKKYQMAQSNTNYDEIRRQNRSGVAVSPKQYQNEQQEQSYNNEKTQTLYDYSSPQQNSADSQGLYDHYKPQSVGNVFDMTSEFTESDKPNRRAPPIYSLSDEPTYMSGTPSGAQKTDYYR